MLTKCARQTRAPGLLLAQYGKELVSLCALMSENFIHPLQKEKKNCVSKGDIVHEIF